MGHMIHQTPIPLLRRMSVKLIIKSGRNARMDIGHLGDVIH
jgi:hypothetical protein